jgi:MFS family permease
VVWSLAAAGCGLATSFNHLLVARFFVGAGEAALVPAALSLISDIFPKRRLAGAVAFFSIGTSLGGGISMGLGGVMIDLLSAGPLKLPLLGVVEPWQAVFLITGSPGVVLAFLVFLIPEPGRGGRDVKATSWGALLRFMSERRALFACHFAGFSLLGLLAYGAAAWIPALLMRRYALTAGQAGVGYGAVVSITSIVGMLSAGVLLDNMIRRGLSDAPLRVFVWTTPLLLVFAVVGCMSSSPVVFLICIGLAQFGLCVAGPAATAIQFVTPAEMRGRVSALFILTFNLVGFGVGPSMMAWFTTHLFRDPQAVHLSVATTYAIVAPIAWLMFLAGLRPMRAAMAQAETFPDVTRATE